MLDIKDAFGIKPVGEAGLKVTEATVQGVSSFMKSVCKPGLEELGFLIKDKVRLWRLNNILKILEKAKGRMNFDGQDLNLVANPRVALSIIEGGSEVDSDDLQELWAGLFVSSCTPDGRDDSNMNFVDLLKRMSSVEARILAYGCIHCKKVLYPNKLIMAEDYTIPFELLTRITGVEDVYRLDSELDHMRSIELLPHGNFGEDGGGFLASDEKLEANITPSPLALNLYYKTHATGISPVAYWGDRLVPSAEVEKGEEEL